MAKTFVTTVAVDGFEAGTEWTYKEVQKQFGPNRFREMKANGRLVEIPKGPSATRAALRSKVKAFKDDSSLELSPYTDPVVAAAVLEKVAADEAPMTELQADAYSVLSMHGDLTAAEVAALMKLPGGAIRVSGVLSSMVERGLIASRRDARRSRYSVLGSRK